jgi:hypothetical protein
MGKTRIMPKRRPWTTREYGKEEDNAQKNVLNSKRI